MHARVLLNFHKAIVFALRMCYSIFKPDFLVVFYFNSIIQKIHAFQHTVQLRDFLRELNFRYILFNSLVVKTREEKGMGKFDEETYGYLAVKEYFADLINAGCFGGEQVVLAGDLEELSGRTQGEAEDKGRQASPHIHCVFLPWRGKMERSEVVEGRDGFRGGRRKMGKTV